MGRDGKRERGDVEGENRRIKCERERTGYKMKMNLTFLEDIYWGKRKDDSAKETDRTHEKGEDSFLILYISFVFNDCHINNLNRYQVLQTCLIDYWRLMKWNNTACRNCFLFFSSLILFSLDMNLILLIKFRGIRDPERFSYKFNLM